VRHLLFQCPAATDIWQALDLNNFIDDVSQLDRSGSIVLEIIIRRDDNTLSVKGSYERLEGGGVNRSYPIFNTFAS
jgi:hypothetical protein